MVKVIKFGTWQTSNFASVFLAKLVFACLGQNRITHVRIPPSQNSISHQEQLFFRKPTPGFFQKGEITRLRLKKQNGGKVDRLIQ